MTQAQLKELSFAAQYLLGQLISVADEDCRATVIGELPDSIAAGFDGTTDVSLLANEIFRHTFRISDGNSEFRFSAFNSLSSHANGRLSVLLAPEFLKWPGKSQFVEVFQKGLVRH